MPFLAEHVPRFERLAQRRDACRAPPPRRTSESGTRSAGRTSRARSVKPCRCMSSEHVVEIELDEVGQHEAIVQLGAPAHRGAPGTAVPRTARPGCAAAAAARGSCARAAASRRRASPAARGVRTVLSGEYSLSMQNSARCVLPVTSVSRWRNTRSTSQGGGTVERSGSCENAISSSYTLSCRASSTRGAWLVGPMNSPEKRYDSDGWLCQ